ncbi:MAG: HU family DNA-binding protein [Bacteroidales bacterium]|jgi:nucleoid DNA-binding protein|nr:HU family DNA-binding protein [Bacteroidales bacterium]
MKEKLVLQDIVDALAKKTSLNKKEADTFFREFFAAIIDNIFNSEPVKIKDFGTFKLVTVDSRETVDVNTGERIVIPAHAKISFLPDKVLKALVNKPFAHFEIAPLKEGISFSDIEESEEPAELQDEDTAIDEPEVVKPTVKPAQPETKKPVETPKPESPVVPVSQSFVYTYTSGNKEEDSSSITLVVPADKTNGIPISVAVAETPTGQQPEEQQPEAKETSLEISKVQEKIGQLKGAIEALSKVKNQTPEPAVVGEEEKSEAVEPEPAQETNPVQEDSYEDALRKRRAETAAEIKEALRRSDELVMEKTVEPTPEPVVEVPAEEPEPIVLPDNNNVAFDPIENDDKETAPENDDSDDDEIADYEYQYPDYDKQTGWAAIRRRLPIIVFLLAIIGIGSYLIYNIIESNNKIGRQPSGYHGFPQNDDSLSTKNDPILSHADSLINSSNSEIDSDVDDTLVIPPPVENTEDKQEVNAADTSLTTPSESSVIISEHLKISVPNKASYMQNRKTEGASNASVPVVSGNASALIETIKPGSSLLSIAQTYYKNRIFWVYIYEENKDKIGKDYDNISAGDRIVIPAPKKYGIDPDNPESIAKAKELERVIHASRNKR